MSLGMSLELQRDQTPRFHSSRLSREISLLCCSIVLGRVLIGHNKVSVLLCCLSRALNGDKDGKPSLWETEMTKWVAERIYQTSRKRDASQRWIAGCATALRYSVLTKGSFECVSFLLFTFLISRFPTLSIFLVSSTLLFPSWMPLSWFFLHNLLFLLWRQLFWHWDSTNFLSIEERTSKSISALSK